jgi:hypothetical protein
VYWLRYVRDGETRVVIMDGWSLLHARLRAAWLELGTFLEGYPINPTARLPQGTVGRVLSHEEAMALLDLPKKPPAASLTRRSH